jgi:hypothetical protein
LVLIWPVLLEAHEIAVMERRSSEARFKKERGFMVVDIRNYEGARSMRQFVDELIRRFLDKLQSRITFELSCHIFVATIFFENPWSRRDAIGLSC